ncbi:ribonuclease H-like domain-containing protein [Tanacetum coccineum]
MVVSTRNTSVPIPNETDVSLRDVVARLQEVRKGEGTSRQYSRLTKLEFLKFSGKDQSLYGLKQAPCAWFQRFASYALRVGFSSSRCDSSLFIYQQGISLTRDSTVDTKSKLGPDEDLVLDPTLYRSLAGGLQYLTFTPPDISYAVQQICLFIHDPREPHLATLKRVLRYVRGALLLDVAEYRGVANVVAAETAWIPNLLRELHSPLLSVTLV